MPKINLRLSDEEHAELERWAHDGQRSIQKEIIFRLFSMHHVRKTAGAGPRVPVSADSQARDVAARTIRVGACLMSVPRGTTCKSCGKVHG